MQLVASQQMFRRKISPPSSGLKSKPSKYHYEAGRFSVSAIFVPEDGGDMFLRTVGGLSGDYRMLYPKRHKSVYLLKM
jgi:hypothetical protein